MEPDVTRPCKACKQDKPNEEFYSEHWKKHVLTCAGCRAPGNDRRATRRSLLGPEGLRAENLRSNYGVSVEEYDRLRSEQDLRCAICGRHEDDIVAIRSGRPPKDGRPKAPSFKLVVDHCHGSNRVRGLLCSQCNSAIGLLGESSEIVAAALRYLELHDRAAKSVVLQPEPNETVI